jgi:hypothetical protein
VYSTSLTDLRQLALLALLLAAGCAPVRRTWPVSRDPRIQFDGARLRAYGAAMTSQKAADKDALDALRLYLSRLAPAVRVEAVMLRAKPEPVKVKEPGAYTALIDLDRAQVQKQLGTRYD